MTQITDRIPDNVKWASFGVVPGALVTLGVAGGKLVGMKDVRALEAGGKTTAIASTLAFDVMTIANLTLPNDRHQSAIVGAATGGALAAGTAASFAWVLGQTPPRNLSTVRYVASVALWGLGVGVAAGAVAGFFAAGKGQSS